MTPWKFLLWSKERLGLGEDRAWIVLTESNRFVGPGPDIRSDDTENGYLCLLPLTQPIVAGFGSHPANGMAAAVRFRAARRGGITHARFLLP